MISKYTTTIILLIIFGLLGYLAYLAYIVFQDVSDINSCSKNSDCILAKLDGCGTPTSINKLYKNSWNKKNDWVVWLYELSGIPCVDIPQMQDYSPICVDKKCGVEKIGK